MSPLVIKQRSFLLFPAQTDVDNPMEDHLELALAWNRADIAKNDILTDDRKINDNEVLARTLINAIKQVSFIMTS